MTLTERIPEVIKNIASGFFAGTYEPHKKPSKLYRMADRPTKKPYDFKKTKKRRKIAKASKRRNK